jgi:dihydroxyacetone kinase-like predicted kinase
MARVVDAGVLRDTGTSLFFTQRAVTEALDAVDAEDLAVLGEAVSRSELMSARGNSGVILSQVLRGLCARLCRNGPAGPEGLAGPARAVQVGEIMRPEVRTGLVAVAPGEGADRLFRSRGAEIVAAEGLSAEDLRRAIDRTGAAGALVLTNGVDLPAEEALAGEDVQILVTGSVPEGLAAAGVVWSGASLDESEIRAREAAVSGEDAGRAAGAVREAIPWLEVEVHRGDQSGSAALVGVE